VIGVVAVLPRGSSSSTSSGSRKSVEAAQPPASQLGAASAQGSATPGPTSSTGTAGGALALQAAAYRDVAVVRAGPLRGAGQSFTVVRVLKGSPPPSFPLVLRSIGSAPLDGSLAIAYLRPVAAATAGGPPSFSYNEQPALVVALPSGVAPSAVRLP
jgi:hypothetical protein